jgi:hypothetical protein
MLCTQLLVKTIVSDKDSWTWSVKLSNEDSCASYWGQTTGGLHSVSDEDGEDNVNVSDNDQEDRLMSCINVSDEDS